MIRNRSSLPNFSVECDTDNEESLTPIKDLAKSQPSLLSSRLRFAALLCFVFGTAVYLFLSAAIVPDRKKFIRGNL